MKKVMVLGVSGAFGSAVAQELKTQGYQVSAMVRDTSKQNIKGIHYQQGDAAISSDVEAACQGQDIVVFAINPPKYDWKNKSLAYLQHVLDAAKTHHFTLIFPGNVYAFDPQMNANVDERSPQHARSFLGDIRMQMEQAIEKDAHNGVQSVILRMGDFISPNQQSSWLPTLLKNKGSKFQLSTPGNTKIKHSWVYTKDAAQIIAALIPHLAALPKFNVFHMRGYALSFSDLARVIQKSTGKTVRLTNMPWWPFKLLKPFSPLFTGLLSMRYLWQEELTMSDGKLRDLLAEKMPNTPIETALKDSALI